MEQLPDRQVRIIQIIVAAMAAGLIVFGLVAVVLGQTMKPDPGLASVMLPALVILGGSEFMAFLVLRTTTLNALRNEIGQLSSSEADQKVLGAYTTLTLIRSAMAEGFGLFGTTILLVTGARLALAAPLLALAVLATGFPTRHKLADLTATMTGRNPFAG